MSEVFDVLVIGGGFYGCRTALQLATAGKKVALIEKNSDLMQRASKWNQARVHHGYHYPRHTLTALSSAKNYTRFVREYKECIYDKFTHLYAVPRIGSMITAQQFARFMNRVALPTKPAPSALRKFFSEEKFQEIYQVEEVVFDSVMIQRRLEQELLNSGTLVLLETAISSIVFDNNNWIVRLTTDQVLSAKKIFNCTYSGINEVLLKAEIPALPLRIELAEMALVKPPAELSGIGVTVMDGPFFSILPYPSLGLHTVSHVRYTPHCSFLEMVDPKVGLGKRWPKSKFPHMSRAIQAYFPAISQMDYQDSVWEFKTILPRNDANDGRPILFHQHKVNGDFVSLMGGKIDNFYDLEALLADGF